MAKFKQKFYRVFNLFYNDNTDNYETEAAINNGQAAMFDSLEQAERFIQSYDYKYNQLTILTVWE